MPGEPITTEHEQRGNDGRHERAEERDDRDRAGEYAEREVVRDVEKVQPDRGEDREHEHRQQLADDPGAERRSQVREHVSHEVAVDGWEECDHPLAVQSRVRGEVDRHDGDREDIDPGVDDADDFRNEVA